MEQENKMNRRNFIKTVGAAGIGSVLAGRKILAEPNEPNAPAAKQQTAMPQVPKRKLGKTGVEVPIFSFGAMFNIMENQVHLRKTLQYGVDYWDTADCYANGNSELGIGKFFKANPDKRKDVFLVTKACSREPAGIEDLLQRSLKRMETNYIDLYFLHSVKEGDELTDDIRKWADDAKKRGLIRFFGFSTHKNMPECLNAAAKTDWIDAIMTSYNFRLMQDKQLSDAIEACYQKGIGLVAMKTQGLKVEGGLTEADKKLMDHFTKQGFTEGQAKIKAVLTDQRFASANVGWQKPDAFNAGYCRGTGQNRTYAGGYGCFQRIRDGKLQRILRRLRQYLRRSVARRSICQRHYALYDVLQQLRRPAGCERFVRDDSETGERKTAEPSITKP